MRQKTKRFIPLAALVATALAVVSAAWACTVAANVAVSPESGPAGTSVTVTGKTFGPGPIEVRWNGTQGQVLAIGQGPDFSIPVTIPAEATPDVYYLVARQNSGSAVFKATETIEVTEARGSANQGASAKAVNSDLWSGLNRSTSVDIDGAAADASTSALPLGAGLAMVGVIGTAAAVTLTVVRRRSSAGATKQHR